eukprot:gene6560-9016_t
MKTSNLDDKQKRLLSGILKLSEFGDKLNIGEEASSLNLTGKTKEVTKLNHQDSNRMPITIQSDVVVDIDSKFSGSAFLNSPEPQSLPLPLFEDGYFEELK